MSWFLKRRNIIFWQVLFLLLSTSWLFAPQLNHLLSDRTSLISQYESPGQPFSSLMRFADFSGGLLMLALAISYIKRFKAKQAGYLLMIAGIGMSIDPIFTTTCKLIGSQCTEFYSVNFLLHATETVATALAFYALAVYDTWRRKRLVSLGFLVFQTAYLGLFVSQYATHAHYNTITQFSYQLILVVWTAWFGRDFVNDRLVARGEFARAALIKNSLAVWAFGNGLLAVLLSLKDLNLYGHLRGLYFASDNAWLAQHGVIIGVILLYLSRHLARGERRARQIFLVLAGVEVLKYSVITPHWQLLIFYLFSFCLLFIWRDVFDRGTVPMTWQVRAKEVAFMVSALLLSALISLVALDRDNKVAVVSSRAIDNFFDYVIGSENVPQSHLQSVLLAHTISAFLLAGAMAILWILFKPNRPLISGHGDYYKLRKLLQDFSNSSEDFFKLWPRDKRYFWATDMNGFVAYKIVGSVAFALADPVASKPGRGELLRDFIVWARSQRLRACFLPVYKNSLTMYDAAGLNSLQIGSSALIDARAFIAETSNDKWWRWQKNRALKAGFMYGLSQPPHSEVLLKELRSVSDSWLTKAGHKERGFALGYFEEKYLQKCVVHYLKTDAGDIAAFTNQVPVFKQFDIATVDLLRHQPEANNAMPYLLLKTIESVAPKYRYFDLGFVPFAAVSNRGVQIAKALSAGRFSSRGLEQFKNKFDPVWEPNYLAYDGDLADLALIALNLERAMELDD